MAESYSIDTLGYMLNNYLHKRIDDNKVLVTTTHGGWAILTDEEFTLLRIGNVESNIKLYNLLSQEGIIYSEDSVPRIIRQCKNKYKQVFDTTTLHILTPTLRCNQKCIYCYSSAKSTLSKEYDMTEDTAKAVIDFIFQCPSKNITIEFQGGEPLMNFPIIKYIVTYIREFKKESDKNVNFRIVTNLTLMDEEKLTWLVENKIELNSSFDGPREIHNKNRIYEGSKGTYDEVIDQLRLLQSKGINVGIMPTITKHSLPYWKEIIDEYVRLGVNRFWARRLNVGGFAADKWKEVGYSAEEYLAFWKKSLNYIFKLNEEGIKISEGSIEIILRNIIFSKKYNGFVCLASPCGCAWSQVAYNYKGDIYTCDEARSFELFKLGNVKENNYKDLYSSWKVLDIVDLTTGLSFDCSNCIYNAFCGPCLIDEYGERGNIIKKTGSFNCKVKKGMMDHIFKEIIPDEKKFNLVKKWIGIEKSISNS